MANSLLHTLPYPVRGAAYTLWLDFVDSSDDPTDPTSPDTEVSLDGAAHADATEELTVVGYGSAYITLTAAEMTADIVDVIAKGSGVRTAKARVFPRNFPVEASGEVLSASADQVVGNITTGGASLSDRLGAIILLTSGTGAGQARVIVSTSSHVAPDWETVPDATTTFDVLQTPDMEPSPVAALASEALLSPIANSVVPSSGSGVVDRLATLQSSVTSVAFSLSGVGTNVSTLLTRLSAARAGYLDNLSAGAVALASAVQTLIDRLTAARAGYLDNLSAGAVAQQATATAIQAKTDNLPASPAATGAQMDLIDAPNATALEAAADALLTRDWTEIVAWPARCALQALRLLRNRWAIASGTLTVYREDDSTTAWTGAATRQAADAVTEIDPA